MAKETNNWLLLSKDECSFCTLCLEFAKHERFIKYICPCFVEIVKEE